MRLFTAIMWYRYTGISLQSGHADGRDDYIKTSCVFCGAMLEYLPSAHTCVRYKYKEVRQDGRGK